MWAKTGSRGVHGICAKMREGRTLEGYILVCLATLASSSTSAIGARIEERVRVVRGGSQAGRTDGHSGRRTSEGRHKHGEACRGDNETAYVNEMRTRAGCVRDDDGD